MCKIVKILDDNHTRWRIEQKVTRAKHDDVPKREVTTTNEWMIHIKIMCRDASKGHNREPLQPRGIHAEVTQRLTEAGRREKDATEFAEKERHE